VDFACDIELAGYRPGRIEVKDPVLAEELRRLLTEVEVEVHQREKLFRRRCDIHDAVYSWPLEQ